MYKYRHDFYVGIFGDIHIVLVNKKLYEFVEEH
jgi:hypothetical protein